MDSHSLGCAREGRGNILLEAGIPKITVADVPLLLGSSSVPGWELGVVT